MRKRLRKKLAQRHSESYDRTTPDDAPVPDTPQWSVGEMPVTWQADEIKKLHKKTLRANLKRGVITREIYVKLLYPEAPVKKEVKGKSYIGPSQLEKWGNLPPLEKYELMPVAMQIEGWHGDYELLRMQEGNDHCVTMYGFKRYMKEREWVTTSGQALPLYKIFR